jgi:hypothetical protein
LELGYDMTLLVVGRFSVTPSHRTPHDVFAWPQADSLANDVDTPHD